VRAPINPASLYAARYVLRSHNLNVESSLPVVGGVQYVDLRAASEIEQVNVLIALRAMGIIFLFPPKMEGPLPVPAPVLTALVPASVLHTTKLLTLTASGAGFLNGCVINYGGGDFVTTFQNNTSVSCTLLQNDLIPKGNYPVYVKNRDGQLSATLTFVST
jgi:hypothetical protein